MSFASRLLFSSADTIPGGLDLPLAILPFAGLAVGYYVSPAFLPSASGVFEEAARVLASGNMDTIRAFFAQYAILGDETLTAAGVQRQLDAYFDNRKFLGGIIGFVVGGLLMFLGAASISRDVTR